MRVTKSKSQKSRDVAILLDKDTILTDCGEMAYDRTLTETKIYASRKLIGDIFYKEKIGEILRYDGEIIKWRKECPRHYKDRATWHFSNPKEVHVSNSRIWPDDPTKALEAYSNYRDWVESYGGNIVGSISSTSWSLFRAVLGKEGWQSPYESVPGITHPIGGRVLPSKSLWTSFQGDFIQWDLYSAYSRRLSRIQFGGTSSRWIQINRTINFDRLIDEGKCVYIEADITLPDGISLGPLPNRRNSYSSRPYYNIAFPTRGILQGIWTYEELRNAEAIGARIRFRKAYVHIATGRRYFFEDWYRVIQEGRSNLDGLARSLAKQTGNALWGRFAMQIKPAKTCWRENGKRVTKKHPTRTIKRNQCMELADQLCGKIRSDLYGLAISAGNNLVQGHTDGAWIKYDERWRPPNDDWRVKQRASRIDLIDDTTYRYWIPGEENARYIVPGVDTDYTERHFDRLWESHETRIL